jgi:hypothetical protein
MPLPDLAELGLGRAITDRRRDLTALHHSVADVGAVGHEGLAHPQPIAGHTVRASNKFVTVLPAVRTLPPASFTEIIVREAGFLPRRKKSNDASRLRLTPGEDRVHHLAAEKNGTFFHLITSRSAGL